MVAVFTVFLVQSFDYTAAARLAKVRQALEQENYAPVARALLADIDAELKEIGYDAAAHDMARQREQAGRAAEASLRQLESARSASQPIEREIEEATLHPGTDNLTLSELKRRKLQLKDEISRLTADTVH